jgi:type II secretory pathway pseudopilin PulG
MEVQDTISAEAAGYVTVAIINRLSVAITGIRIVSLVQDPITTDNNRLSPPDNYVIIKATVTQDDSATPAVGEQVTFSITAGGGTLSAYTAITDNNGEAYVYFMRPDTGSGDTIVRAQLQATTNGSDATTVVHWTDGT